MNKYTDRFAALFKDLKSNPVIEVLSANLIENEDEALAKFSFQKLEKNGFLLPNDIIDCLDFTRECNLRYLYYLNDNIYGGGEFYLNPLSNVLNSLKDPELYNNFTPENEVNILKNFRVFDEHPFSGDFKLAAFHIDPLVEPKNLPDIYFFDRGEFYMMKIGYIDYINALLELKGITNWQYLFCDVDLHAPNKKYLISSIKNGLEFLKNSFHSSNYDDYLELLK